MRNIKEIEIKGKTYKLTTTRRIIKVLSEICPEVLNLDKGVDGVEIGVNILAELDILFYELLKPAHPDISKETADKILENAEEEYEDIAPSLINFALSSFIQGDQTKKKAKLGW